ncbi:trans-sulfuration enzyme family protein [Francisella marina]|uniref:PLP-dependent transferase n=1 Tax=Francisella marina TaxID=2249302 RepID=A0ABX5ZIX5_9GAMM|nr:PLP-dependent aspartate aminotransferase family protein [Francisella marina]QEO57987.1 PLP-dependent transferase [Francisella marina]QEO59786.1 PLP-dependent transferase [Francisella marina]
MTIINSKIDTLAVHAGNPGDSVTGAVTTPIYTSSVYRQQSPGGEKAFEYGRVGNPTRSSYEQAIAELEGAKKGYAFSSGVAAINAVLDILGVDSHIIATDALYGGTYRLFEEVKKYSAGLQATYTNLSDLDNLEENLRENTKMIWVETPSNPLLRVVDLERLGQFCKKHGLIFVVDNTFATPYNLKPISFGADIVIHSASKYISGHSDVISGIVVVNDNDKLIKKLDLIHLAGGAVSSPFDSFLATRGLRTLALRVRQHNYNALTLAKWLEQHRLVKRVYYPGLESSPDYHLAKAQMNGFGGVLSLELNGSDNLAKAFLEELELFAITVSAGGVESLSSIPALMSHSSIPREVRLEQGLSDGLIRLSIGIEDVEDLRNDIEQALIKATTKKRGVDEITDYSQAV